MEQLLGLLADSSKYVVHRRPDPLVGTLRDVLRASDPAGDSPHAQRGVYVMRGVSGAPCGPWGVVFLLDGRFKPYHNSEWICDRDLYPDEAVGWYSVKTLQEGKAIWRTRQPEL